MIDVCVREHHGVNGRGMNGECGPVPLAQLLESLKLSAVDEEPLIVSLEEVLGTGDGACGTEKRQRGHQHTVLVLESRSFRDTTDNPR